MRAHFGSTTTANDGCRCGTGSALAVVGWYLFVIFFYSRRFFPFARAPLTVRSRTRTHVAPTHCAAADNLGGGVVIIIIVAGADAHARTVNTRTHKHAGPESTHGQTDATRRDRRATCGGRAGGRVRTLYTVPAYLHLPRHARAKPSPTSS